MPSGFGSSVGFSVTWVHFWGCGITSEINFPYIWILSSALWARASVWSCLLGFLFSISTLSQKKQRLLWHSPFRWSVLERCFCFAWGLTLSFFTAQEAVGSGGAGREKSTQHTSGAQVWFSCSRKLQQSNVMLIHTWEGLEISEFCQWTFKVCC